MAITIKGKVHNLRQTDKSVFCGINIYNVQKKVGAFLNAQFIKDAFEPATRLENKDMIEVIEGFMTADEYKEIKSIRLVVTEFKNLTNPEENGGGDFPQVDDESGLPF